MSDLQELLDKLAKAGHTTEESPVVAIPTGISSFDMSTGIGGIPRNRISIFQGEEHSGKTLLLLTLIAAVQKAGGQAAFIDAEKALTPSFAQLLGVDYDALVKYRPRTMDACYDIARELASSGLFDVVGWDSITALPTAASLLLGASDSKQRADQAQMNAQELPKMTALLHERTSFVIINQVRVNPNPPTWHRGGPLLYTPGGKALRHASSLSVEVKGGQVYRNGDERIGQQIRTTCIKNKVGVPHQKAEFDLMYKQGLDLLTSMVDTAIELGVIRQQSSWFYIDITTPGQEEVDTKRYAGRAAMETALRSDPDLHSYIVTALREYEEAEEATN